MQLGFHTKQAILERLSDPENWEKREILPEEDPYEGEKIRFKDGQKYIETSEGLINLPKASDPEEKNKELRSGRFSHTIFFSFNDWPGLRYDQVINAVKLTVAHDLGLEPDLRAVGKIESIEDFEPDIITGKITLQFNYSAWGDIAEYDGHDVEIPHSFAIGKCRDEDGFHLATDFSGYDWITNHTRFIDFLGMPPQPETTYKDKQGKAWNISFEPANNAISTANEKRQRLAQHYNLDRREFVCIAYSPELLITAYDQGAMTRAKAALEASQTLRDAIKGREVTDMTRAEEIIGETVSAGADLKYIDQKAARNGNTFADLMVENNQFALLTAYKNHVKYIHNLTVEKPDPPRLST